MRAARICAFSHGGVAYELRDCFEVHRDVLTATNARIEEIRISGGIVRNRLWLQILADILNTPLRVPRVAELGALGAAMNAAVGVGFYDNHEQAARQMVAISREVEPSPQNRAAYAHGYDLFKSGYQNSSKIYRQ